MTALDPKDQELLEAARSATKHAYAPYSRFKVGAALRLRSEKIIWASNKENASFPAGICAERNALNLAHDHHKGDAIVTIAVAAETDQFSLNDFLAPCGICRQVICETEKVQDAPVKVILDGPSGRVRVLENAASLLPFHFYLKELKK